MENNKLLIGVQFIEPGSNKSLVFELIVLRDLTLKQLLDGIKYGLAKKEGEEFYQRCRRIFEDSVSVRDQSGLYRRITLTAYNNAVSEDKEKGGRFPITEEDMTRTLVDIGFISSTRIVFDPQETYRSYEINTSAIIPAFNPSEQKEDGVSFPDYNISTRQLYRFDDTPIEVIPPSQPPQKSDQNLFFMILPTLIMISVTILTRTLAGNGTGAITGVLLTALMSAVTLVTSIINFIRTKKKYKRNLEAWRRTYEAYIDKTIADILERQKQDTEKLSELYPDVNELFDEKNPYKSVYGVSGNIFSRWQQDADFMTVRLGISDEVPNQFEIVGSKQAEMFSSNVFKLKFDKVKVLISDDEEYENNDDETFYLSNLPNYISEKYKYMKHAPMLFSMKNCGALGIVSPNKVFSDRLIQRIVYDLCFYQSPEDLQFIVLFEPTDDPDKIESAVANYKFLPHFRDLFPDRSQFVFDQTNANMVFSSMLNIMAERAPKKEDEEQERVRFPRIVFIVFHEYALKEHAFAQYLPKVPEEGKSYENSLGLTFIFPKTYKEHLPAYCDHVISFTSDHTAELIPHENEGMRREFGFNMTPEWNARIYNTSKILSSLCFSKISQNGKVPSAVSLFELYGFTKNNIDLAAFWDGEKRANVIETLSVPIGKTESGLTYLDLHEDFDGPHMLVAGTTGSGKSETIITYLLGLCLYYRPDEVNLMLVDMKGGGFIKRIGTLPHVVGSVTDVDGDENGTGAEYMLKRFLDALRSEIKRRKILFNSMHVDSINQYISACRNIDSHIKKINNRLRGEDKEPLTEAEEEQIRTQARENSLAHLVLVVDEFTELKRFSTESNNVDFIGEITTIARVGRSLGFHIILISQNIEGAITDDIRVNSKSRLCLKVATRQASKEMLGNDLAASPSMPGHGRAYLLVGTGSKFEYFQSGYAGAVAEENFEMPMEMVEASKTGGYTKFYRSEKDNLDALRRKKELEAQGKLETQLNAVVGSIKTYYNRNKQRYPKVHIIFEKPLPGRMVFENGNIYEERDGRFELMREAAE
ncbi:MAG: cell division protein FtsK [Ruminococcus sp.]|nr:cell division protein FtsK [Ruminococcus sp.]